MSDLWTVVEDGTAQGPVFYVDGPGGVFVLQALWSDVEGVVVSVEIQGDGIQNRETVRQVSAAVSQILALEPPVTREEAKL